MRWSPPSCVFRRGGDIVNFNLSGTGKMLHLVRATILFGCFGVSRLTL